MKKLYKSKKSAGKVNPSVSSGMDDYLALLIPSAILTLIASLSEEDKQVLAYLISICNTKSFNVHDKAKARDQAKPSCFSGNKDNHSPAFDCDCFGCYMSFWARWDASENRQLIHEIIEAYEEDLARKKMVKSGGKVKKSKRRNSCNRICDEPRVGSEEVLVKEEKVVEELVGLKEDIGYGLEDCKEEEGGEAGNDKGSFRRLLSFVGEKVSGFWNMG